MSALGLTADLLTFSLGWLIAHRCWPMTGRRSGAEFALLAFLGWPIGVGVTSSLFFVCSLCSTHPAIYSASAELGLMLMVGLRGGARPPGALVPRSGLHAVRPSALGDRAPPHSSLLEGSLLTLLLLSLVAQCALAALVLSLRAAHLEPFGSWDGWAIWNLHARFMFRAGPDWPAALGAPELNWTHADYPWLVPAGVARVWSWMGRESPLGSASFGLLFGIATAGLLGAALWRRRGPVAASLAVLVLLSTPFFVTFSSNEHADVPFGLYLLACSVLIAEAPSPSRRLAFLTGLMIGFTPWVKNEGLLWLPLACVGWMVTRWSATSGRAWRPTEFGPETRSDKARSEIALHLSFAAGIVLALLPLLYFKLHLAPPNDLAASHPADRLAQLFTPERHRIILSSLRRDVLGFGQWRWVPLLPLALALIGAGGRRLSLSEWAVAALLLLMLAGYYVVYLLTPMDLHWHLDSSLVRLLLQLWPAGLFWWGLAAALPDWGVERDLRARRAKPRSGPNAEQARPEVALHHALASASGGRARPRRAGRPVHWLVGNGLAAAVLLAGLNRHLAPGELARTSWRIHPVHASVANGWYAPESQGSVRWVWSSGHATLRLYSATPQTIRVRFALRGLQAQRVTAQWQGHSIWSAAVGTALQRGELPELTVPAGGADLIFSFRSPRPARIQRVGDTRATSPEAAGRTLAFALYQLQIE